MQERRVFKASVVRLVRIKFKLNSLLELVIQYDADAKDKYFSWYEPVLAIWSPFYNFFIIQSLAYLHAHDCSERTAALFTCQEIF